MMRTARADRLGNFKEENGLLNSLALSKKIYNSPFMGCFFLNIFTLN